MLNQGGGRFGSTASYAVVGGAPVGIAVDDFNDDCWPDVVVSVLTFDTQCGGNLYLFLNRGDGTFSNPLSIDSGLQSPFGIAAYGPAGGLSPSLAVADRCSGQFEILPNLTQP